MFQRTSRGNQYLVLNLIQLIRKVYELLGFLLPNAFDGTRQAVAPIGVKIDKANSRA